MTFFVFLILVGKSGKWYPVNRDVECTLIVNLGLLNSLKRDEKAFAPK